MRRVVSTQQLDALPTGAVVLIETDAPWSDPMAAIKREQDKWVATELADMPDPWTNEDVLRPWGTPRKYEVRTYVLHTPGVDA